MTPTQIPHHLSAPSPHPPPRILPNKDPLQFSTPLPSLKRFLAQTPLLHQVLQSKKLVCELLLFLSNRDPHSINQLLSIIKHNTPPLFPPHKKPTRSCPKFFFYLVKETGCRKTMAKI